MAISINGIPTDVFGGRPQRRKVSVLGLITGVWFGLLFIGAAIFVYVAFSPPSGWTKIQGKVVSVETLKDSNDTTVYAPVVGYSIGSKDYTVTSSMRSSGRPTEGELKTVLYNPFNPNDATVDEPFLQQLFIIIFAVLGAFFVITTIIGFIRSSKREKQISDVRTSGQKISGIVTAMTESRVSSNGNRSFTVTVSAADGTGTVRDYISDPLTGLAGIASMDFKTNPIPIDVYVDPIDPTKYFVDTSALPALTPEKIASMIGDVIESKKLPL
ncbi:MAG: DUF3592 domain-containing protein [Candidatus Microsaccharimonas sp.]